MWNMPVLFIYGLQELDLQKQNQLHNQVGDLRKSIAEILNISASAVSVYAPSTFIAISSTKEIVVFVEGLIEKPDRTLEIKQEIAETTKRWLADFVSSQEEEYPQIDVFVKSFDTHKDGFA